MRALRSGSFIAGTALIVTVAAACQASGGSTSLPRHGDPLIVAVGDIACDPANPSFADGQGTTNNCQQAATSDLAVAANPTAVLALGDIQYDCGGGAAFAASYDPTWGRQTAITHPVPGNQEYNAAGTDCPASGTAAGYFSYFGSSAGGLEQGWYSFDLGSWHIIAVNANCDMVGGCGNGSPQETWLEADLKAHPSTCTLAFWHQPRFSSGSHNNDGQMGDA